MLRASRDLVQRYIGGKGRLLGGLERKVVRGSLGEELPLQGAPEQRLLDLFLSQAITTVTPARTTTAVFQSPDSDGNT